MVRAREVDTDFDNDSDVRVLLLVHDTKPPFLDGRFLFTKQKGERAGAAVIRRRCSEAKHLISNHLYQACLTKGSDPEGCAGASQASASPPLPDLPPPPLPHSAGPVLPLKDSTSDMAVIARQGSKLVKEVRDKKESTKSRQRFWEVAGSKMGKITGVRGGPHMEGEERAARPVVLGGEADQMLCRAEGRALGTSNHGPSPVLLSQGSSPPSGRVSPSMEATHWGVNIPALQACLMHSSRSASGWAGEVDAFYRVK